MRLATTAPCSLAWYCVNVAPAVITVICRNKESKRGKTDTEIPNPPDRLVEAHKLQHTRALIANYGQGNRRSAKQCGQSNKDALSSTALERRAYRVGIGGRELERGLARIEATSLLVMLVREALDNHRSRGRRCESEQLGVRHVHWEAQRARDKKHT